MSGGIYSIPGHALKQRCKMMANPHCDQPIVALLNASAVIQGVEAICETVTQTNTRFVPMKIED